jgi:phytoene dehydrogenase-like protein
LSTPRYDVVVVGGGHNGLVASHYLSSAGLRTLVVERRDEVGGMCSRIEFMPGYFGSITNSPGSLEPKVVQDMRLEEFGLRFHRPDPTVVVPLRDERVFVGWRDPSRVRRQLEDISVADTKAYYELTDFFTEFGRQMGVSLFAPPPSLADLVGRMATPKDEDDFARVFFGSIRDMVEERMDTDEIRTILCQIAVFAGNISPSTPGSPIGLLFRPLSLASSVIDAAHDPRRQPLRGSTGLPIGSMAAVGGAMERATLAKGTEIWKGRGVVAISTSGGQVTGVVLDDGTEVAAGAVVSNLNPKTTMLSLLEPGQIDDELRDRLARLKMAGGAFKVVAALDGVPRWRAAPADQVDAYATCQFRIAPTIDYMEAAYDDFKFGRPSDGPKLMGLVPTMVDPSLAPPGKHLLSLNVWYAPYHLREGDWATEKHRFAERCFDRLAEYVPNIRSLVSDYRCFSPEDLEREFGLVEGHQLYGDMTPQHMFSLRPVAGLSDYRTPLAGLYLSGSGTWPGGFITGIPGHNAAQRVIGDLRDGRLRLQ